MDMHNMTIYELSSWSHTPLNQLFQRVRIDLNQIVEPRRTIFEPGHVLNLRIADEPSAIVASSPTCCAGYNYAHAWLLPLARNSTLTRSNRRSAQPAWASGIERPIRGSNAKWRSKYFLLT